MGNVFAEVVHVRMRPIEPPDGSKTREAEGAAGPLMRKPCSWTHKFPFQEPGRHRKETLLCIPLRD